MGTWGKGNLESDGAQDTLAGICDDLFGQVIELLKHPRSHEYDDVEIDELFVRIEMIFALNDRGMINTSPDPKDLEPLFESYMQRWSAYQGQTDVSWTEERAKVITSSFQQLLKIAEDNSSGSFPHRLNMISEVMSKGDGSETSST